MSSIKKTGTVITSDFTELGSEMSTYLYLKAGCYVVTDVRYNAGDECKAITVIRYATGGTGRDLMGYSGAGAGYWGVTTASTWERHGTFSYTDADITKINTISYIFSSATENGVYQIGRLGTGWTTRDKYIYHVQLYKNGVLVSDLYPKNENGIPGLVDVLTGTFHNAVSNGDNSTGIGQDELFDKKVSIENEQIIGCQFIEI